MFRNHLFKPDSDPGSVSERLGADTYHEDPEAPLLKMGKVAPASGAHQACEAGDGTWRLAHSAGNFRGSASPGPPSWGKLASSLQAPGAHGVWRGLLAALPSPANKTRRSPCPAHSSHPAFPRRACVQLPAHTFSCMSESEKSNKIVAGLAGKGLVLRALGFELVAKVPL